MSLCVLLESSTGKFYLRAIKVDRVVKRSIHSRCRWADKSFSCFWILEREVALIHRFNRKCHRLFWRSFFAFTVNASRFLIHNTPATGSSRILIVLLRIRMASYNATVYSHSFLSHSATFRSLVHPLHANASLLNIIRAGSEYEIVWNWKGNVVPFQLDVLYLSRPRHDADRVTVT